MREDMARIIAHQGRNGLKKNRKTALRIRHHALRVMVSDPDEVDFGPNMLPMSMQSKYRNWASREHGSRMNPLERYLHTKVGKDWNKVYSELRSASTRVFRAWCKDIMNVVDNLVDMECHLGEDGLVYSTRFGWHRVSGLYIHPVTRVLSYQEKVRYNWNTRKSPFLTKLERFDQLTGNNPQNFRIVSEDTVLECVDGIWFIHSFQVFKPNDVVYTYYRYNESRNCSEEVEVLFKDTKNQKPTRRLGSRQMGKKDLRKFREAIETSPY